MVSETPDRGFATVTAGEAEAVLLTTHGIVRIPAGRFEVDGYRYTSLADAVAQAKRSQELGR